MSISKHLKVTAGAGVRIMGVALAGTAAAAVTLAAAALAPASAGQIGAPGPYTVAVAPAVKYALPAADTLIECKPTATAGHFAGPLPAILLIHGGAWGGGSSAIGPGYTGYSGSWCQLWASWGFDAFSVGYRLTKVAPWPAQIVDVQAAVRWVRTNAGSLNINPAMIAVDGDSAGGQLAMIAGYSAGIIPGDLATNNPSVSPQASLVISQFGPWTFGPGRPAGAPSTRAMDYAAQLMLDVQDVQDGRVAVSTPPTLFLQGTKDTIVNQCSQSENADRFLTGNKRLASYIAFPGGHEFTGLVPSTWGVIVGTLQLQTISFAYDQAHTAGILPSTEPGPGVAYGDATMPIGCP